MRPFSHLNCGPSVTRQVYDCLLDVHHAAGTALLERLGAHVTFSILNAALLLVAAVGLGIYGESKDATGALIFLGIFPVLVLALPAVLRLTRRRQRRYLEVERDLVKRMTPPNGGALETLQRDIGRVDLDVFVTARATALKVVLDQQSQPALVVPLGVWCAVTRLAPDRCEHADAKFLIAHECAHVLQRDPGTWPLSLALSSALMNPAYVLATIILIASIALLALGKVPGLVPLVMVGRWCYAVHSLHATTKKHQLRSEYLADIFGALHVGKEHAISVVERFAAKYPSPSHPSRSERVANLRDLSFAPAGSGNALKAEGAEAATSEHADVKAGRGPVQCARPEAGDGVEEDVTRGQAPASADG